MIHRDKIKYFTGCAVISMLMAAVEAYLGAHFTSAWLAGIVAGIAVGVGKEYGDHIAPNRKWDWDDFAADVLGSVTGASMGALFTL